VLADDAEASAALDEQKRRGLMAQRAGQDERTVARIVDEVEAGARVDERLDHAAHRLAHRRPHERRATDGVDAVEVEAALSQQAQRVLGAALGARAQQLLAAVARLA